MTDRMRQALDALKALEKKNEAALKMRRAVPRYAWSHNEIAREMGVHGARRHGNGANQSTTGFNSGGQSIIFTIVALEKAGLVRKVRADDERNRTLHVEITTAGRAA